MGCGVGGWDPFPDCATAKYELGKESFLDIKEAALGNVTTKVNMMPSALIEVSQFKMATF